MTEQKNSIIFSRPYLSGFTTISFIAGLGMLLDHFTTRIALCLGAVELNPLVVFLIENRVWLLYDVISSTLIFFLAEYVYKKHKLVIVVPILYFGIRLVFSYSNYFQLLIRLGGS